MSLRRPGGSRAAHPATGTGDVPCPRLPRACGRPQTMARKITCAISKLLPATLHEWEASVRQAGCSPALLPRAGSVRPLLDAADQTHVPGTACHVKTRWKVPTSPSPSGYPRSSAASYGSGAPTGLRIKRKREASNCTASSQSPASCSRGSPRYRDALSQPYEFQLVERRRNRRRRCGLPGAKCRKSRFEGRTYGNARRGL